MPFKNSGRYINDCIESILSQDFTDWELIAVDDHSNDDSADLLQEFASKHTNIQILNNHGQGIIEALKTAFSQASGKYISRMDSDDIMPEGRLKLMVNALENAPQKTIVTGKVKYFSEDEVSKGYREYQEWLNERIEKQDHWNWIYRECVIASPNWMARKADFEDIGAFKNSTYPEDYDLVFKWYASGFNVRSINKVTLHWREHFERTSRNSDHYSQSAFFQLKLNYFLKLDYKKEGLLLLGAGDKGKLTASFLLQNNIAFRWMEQGADLIGQVVNGVKIEALDLAAIQPPVQVLVGVYPEERGEISGVLDDSGGEWWWL